MTNDELRYVCDTIRAKVPCVEAGKAMGIVTDKKGRCKCFFHGGDHKNLKLYDEDRGYYCFVCHEHGDVIKLVKEYSHCSFMDAVEWLNESFGLHLDLQQNSFYYRRRRAEQYARQYVKEKQNATTDSK